MAISLTVFSTLCQMSKLLFFFLGLLLLSWLISSLHNFYIILFGSGKKSRKKLVLLNFQVAIVDDVIF